MESPERRPRPIFYERNGDTISLKMAADDYESLLAVIGYAAGQASREGDRAKSHMWRELADHMNFMNEHWSRLSARA